MIDIHYIRHFPQCFDKMLRDRGESPCSDSILKMDKEKRSLIHEIQLIQQKKNEIAGKVPQCNEESIKKQLIDESNLLTEKLLEVKKNLAQNQLDSVLAGLPNVLSKKVPLGIDESDNVVIKEWGERQSFAFKPKAHYEMSTLIDFEQTSKISGSRFCTLKGSLAKLERSLIQFMLDYHTENRGFVEYSVPYLVRENAMFGTGQLPKFHYDAFQTYDGYYLIPTGEVPLLNMFRDNIFKNLNSPIRIVGYTPCFRKEAGSACRDTKGIIRQHQFSKVEMVSITKPENSYQELEFILESAELLLRELALPYRIVALCSGDIGFSSAFTYDLEVWFPSQNKYREISSCSNCEDFQARRMKVRYKEDNSNVFTHTLNGSGLPISRTIAAIMENCQTKNGSIKIPEVLKKYMDKEYIIP